MTTGQLTWGDDSLSITVGWSADQPPQLTALRTAGVAVDLPRTGRPLLEVVTVADGHVPAGSRLVQSGIGARARYVAHHDTAVPGGRELVIEVADAVSGVHGEVGWFLGSGVPVLRSTVRVRNDGTRPVALRSVASFVTALGGPPGDDAYGVRGWTLHRALSDWLGEGRWISEPADATLVPDLTRDRTGHRPRGAHAVVSTGTWSSGTHVPVAALVSAKRGIAWAWQIEHNGAWRHELGDDELDGYVALSGPTDVDHQWVRVLAPGETFETVPVAVTVAADLTGAFAHLTAHRRARRRPHPDNRAPKIVFNDYMNTLMGDPTTERLLPLVDAAAAVGAEVFMIDAGWYDDSGHWWDSVGEWEPSTTRFPGGLGEVLDRIRGHGLVPGLWLEPEVVGVRSPVADRLPDEAFLQRAGQRVVEHDRYHLDLRHPAALAHLDAVVDRLVTDLGVGYFKLDYNVDPGAGTDHGADSVGDGLLGHNRAHLAWLDGVLDRHPDLILENCGSGAMRSDFAMLSRLQLQSTSDQEDPMRYPPVAAAAPAAMLPEQAASWAYPQPGMSLEEAAFTLVTGLAGRFYLSGYLNQMAPDQLALVGEAVELAKELRTVLPTTNAFWPLGLPRWDDAWVALGLATSTDAYVVVWSRQADVPRTRIDLGALAGLGLTLGAEVEVEQVFPRSLDAWETAWSPTEGVLDLHNPTGAPSARVLRVVPLAS